MLKRMLSAILICLLLTGCAQTYDGGTVEKQVVTSMSSESWHEGMFDQFHTTSVREYGYDELGRKTYEKWISNGETAFSSRFYWSGDGLECTEVTWDHQGLIPWPDSRVKEVYDEQGNEIERIVYEFWKVTQRSIQSYDDAGNLIRLEILDGDGSLSALQEYTYDAQGNRLKTIDLSDGTERITEYTYDENGNQTGWYYYENGALWEYVEMLYDEQGRKSFSARYDGNGEQKHYWEYTYSADGSSMTTSFSGERTKIEYYDGGSKLPVRIETYDSDGNLTDVTTYTYETIRVPNEPNP